MIKLSENWFQKSPVIIILLIVFFPAGLVLMWKNQSWNKKIKSIITIAFAALTVFFFAVPMTIPIKTLYLPYQMVEMDVGAQKKVTCNITPHMFNIPLHVFFYSSNESVAKFDDDKLTGVGEGTAEIYATDKDGNITSNKVKVTVSDVSLKAKRQKAEPVIYKIASIGDMPTDKKSAINQAQKAYDSLPSDVKPLVTNIGILIAAEENVSTSNKTTNKTKIKSTKNDSETPKVAEKANSTSNIDVSEIVYIGKSGKKYHKKNCSTLKGKGTAISIGEALKKGYTPCKRCKP